MSQQPATNSSQLLVRSTIARQEFKVFMNKGELVDQIADKAECSKKDADAILSALLDTIADVVSGGDKVTLVGFGSFEVKDRQAREGRNPATGKPIQIPATRVPVFSAGKAFKDKLAG